jgi:glucosamine 6-phosphate synthetase-like amidotransferase/phosphosugar isomerase protein
MCGIVGVVSSRSLSLQEKKIVKWMSYFDYVRGVHSTGYMFGNEHSTCGFLKKTGAPWELWAAESAKGFWESPGVLKNNDLKFIVGHNRSATVGAVNTANAHPFRCDHITGVHNGTVLSGLTKLPKAFETDSQSMYYAMSQGWSLEKITQVLNLSYAMVWFDENEKTLNFARNSQRPLWVAISRGNGTMIFASEPWMIKGALSATKATAAFQEPQPIDVNTLYSIDLADTSFQLTAKKTELKTTEPLNPVVAYSSTSKYSYYGANNNSDSGWYTPKNKLTKSEFWKKTGGVCCNCSGSVFYGDYKAGLLKFVLDDSNVVCSDCIVEDELTGGYLSGMY